MAQRKKIVDTQAERRRIVRQILSEIPSCQLMEQGRIPIAVKTNDPTEGDILEKLNNQAAQQIPQDVLILLKLLGELLENELSMNGHLNDQKKAAFSRANKIDILRYNQWQLFGQRMLEEFNSQQVILLRLLFQDKLSVCAASTLLGISQSQAIGLREKSLITLFSGIEDLGLFDKTELRFFEDNEATYLG